MSIRTRITALAMLAVLAVLLVAGFAIVRVHQRLLVETVDERLEQAAASHDGGDLLPPGDDDSLAQLVRDGTVVDSAPPGLTQPVAPDPEADGQPVLRDVSDLVDGEGPYRVLSVTLDDGDVLHLGINLDDVRESTSALQRALVVAIPLVAVVLGAIIWWFVGRALGPVEAIRARVAAIGPDDLDQRVPVPKADDEIARLASTMNGMLDRLERSADQQRRLIADASHELRSPLARMRAELEVDLAHPAGADLAATHLSALEEVDGLQRLVDDLLDIARPAVTTSTSVSVDLDDVVLRVAGPMRLGARAWLDTSGVGAAQVVGDAARLDRLVTNLLDNALRHANATVSVSLGEIDGHAELVVDDDGPGIPTADRERVFEPFTRLDAARTAGTGGAGLGLAIVRDIAVAHGGSVTADERPGGGARFVVRLPTG